MAENLRAVLLLDAGCAECAWGGDTDPLLDGRTWDEAPTTA